jgi:uncharacterized protein with HEPN domain
MRDRDYIDYLQDVVDSVDDIGDFIEGMSFEEFSRDKKTTNAVLRSIEVIGEAAKNVPEEIRKQHPQIPWKKMSGMRDKLIHEYHGVDIETVWQTLQEDIPPLKGQVKNIIKNVKGNNS